LMSEFLNSIKNLKLESFTIQNLDETSENSWESFFSMNQSLPKSDYYDFKIKANKYPSEKLILSISNTLKFIQKSKVYLEFELKKFEISKLNQTYNIFSNHLDADFHKKIKKNFEFRYIENGFAVLLNHPYEKIDEVSIYSPKRNSRISGAIEYDLAIKERPENIIFDLEMKLKYARFLIREIYIKKEYKNYFKKNIDLMRNRETYIIKEYKNYFKINIDLMRNYFSVVRLKIETTHKFYSIFHHLDLDLDLVRDLVHYFYPKKILFQKYSKCDSIDLKDTEFYEIIKKGLGKSLATLSCLKLDGCFDVNYSPGNYDSLKNLSSLVIVNLNFDYRICDIGIKNFSQSLENSASSLTSINLDFKKCSQLSDVGMKELAQSLKKMLMLTNLNLNFASCKKINQMGTLYWSKWIKNMSSLTSIYLNFFECITSTNTDKITNTDIEEEGNSLSMPKSLKNIILDFSRNILNDEGMKYLINPIKSLANLTKLNLNFNGCSITDLGVVEISKVLEKLLLITNLTLSFVQSKELSDTGLKELARTLLKIKTSIKSLVLDFSNCYEMSNAGIEELTKSLNELFFLEYVKLDFRGCCRIDDGFKYELGELLKKKKIRYYCIEFERICISSLTE
jgi:hypothetical protein